METIEATEIDGEEIPKKLLEMKIGHCMWYPPGGCMLYNRTIGGWIVSKYEASEDRTSESSVFVPFPLLDSIC